MTLRWILRLAMLFLGTAILATAAPAQESAAAPLPTFDLSPMIRFETWPQAERRRDLLVRFIWPAGLPDTLPKVTLVKQPRELAGIDQGLISRIEKLQINVGEFDFQALAFRLYPKMPAEPRMKFIVHHGHVPDGEEHYLYLGIDKTIEYLLKHGCDVIVMQMPLMAWNEDRSGKLLDGTPFDVGTGSSSKHDDLFAQIEPRLRGQTFALFLEPVVQVVNLLASEGSENSRIGMIGLSGGGWTTHMAAAIDTRIQVSIPVAGAMPLYARQHSPGSRGDTEQHYEALYREEDRDGDGTSETAAGIASWLEVFALGSVGTAEHPRTQVQVLNLYDKCCFSGHIYRTYDTFLSEKVAKTGAGRWSLFVDQTHRDHIISDEMLDRVLGPMLNSWRR